MQKNNDFIKSSSRELFYKANPKVFMITKNKFYGIIFLILTYSKTYKMMSVEFFYLEILINFVSLMIFYLMIDAITL